MRAYTKIWSVFGILFCVSTVTALASPHTCETTLLWPETISKLGTQWGEKAKTVKTASGEVTVTIKGVPERVVQLDHLGRPSPNGPTFSYSPTLSFEVKSPAGVETFLFYAGKTKATIREGQVELSGQYRHASGRKRPYTGSIWSIIGESLRELGADPDEPQPSFDVEANEYRTVVNYSVSRNGDLRSFSAKRQRFVTKGPFGYWTTEAKFDFF